MKRSAIAAALIGAIVGAVITYSAMRLNGDSAHQAGTPAPKVDDAAEIPSPFDRSKDNEEPDDYFHLLLTDPTDLTQRDIVIAMWYANEVRTVDYLRVNTGHEFGPVWNQRSPIEILEEQLSFWKEYLAESARLKEIARGEQPKTPQPK